MDVESLKADLFQWVSVTDDAGFEKKLLAASLCPGVLHFLGKDGQADDVIGDIASGPGDLSQLDPVEFVVPPARASFSGAERDAVHDHGDLGYDEDLGGDEDDDCPAGCDDGALDLEEQMRKEICEEAMPEGGAGIPLRGKARARQSLTGDLDQLDMFIGVEDDYSYFSKEAARAWAGAYICMFFFFYVCTHTYIYTYIYVCLCVCVYVYTGPVHWSFRKGPAKPLAALPRASDADADGGYTQEDGAAQEFTSAYIKGKKGGKSCC